MTYTYNSNNDRTGIRDPKGGQTSLSYNGMGLVTVITNARGFTQTFTYDAKNNLTASRDQNGGLTTYDYDSQGNVITITNAAGDSAAFSYYPSGQLRYSIDPRGNMTGYSYDQYGYPKNITDALPSVITYTYDVIGRKLSERDAEGRTTSYDYDGLGNVTVITNALTGVVRYTYDGVGRKTGFKNAEDKWTYYGYDVQGNLTIVTDTLTSTTTYEYDANNRRVATTDALGNRTAYGYDSVGRLVTVTNPLSATTIYSYDANGNRTSVKDPEGRVTTYEYDKLSRLLTTTIPLTGTFPLTGTIIYDYDRLGNTTSVTDPEGRVTTYGYDSISRLLTVTNPISSTFYSYDGNGNRTRVTDPEGRVTTYEYDKLNRLTRVIEPLTRTTSYEYDRVGNTKVITDANQSVTRLGYDSLNRNTVITNAEGYPTSFGYDKVGNRTVVTDANSVVTRYAYDSLSRLLSVTDGLTQTTSYGYDKIGNRTVITDASLHVTTFAYDALGRPLTVTYPVSGSVAYTYDKTGNVTRTVDAKGGVVTNTYDAANRLVKGEFADRSVDYQYDKVGSRTAVTETKSVWNWWSQDWPYRLPVTVTNVSTMTLQVTYTVQLVLPGATASDVYSKSTNAGNATGDDLRIVYGWDGYWEELDRELTGFITDAITITFATRTDIPAQGSDGSYYLYYGKSSAGSPPANKERIYLFFDDFSSGNFGKWDTVGVSATVISDNGNYVAKLLGAADSSPGSISAGTNRPDWSNVRVTAKAKNVAQGANGQTFRIGARSLSSPGRWYAFGTWYGNLTGAYYRIWDRDYGLSAVQWIATAAGNWYEYSFAAVGDNVSGYVDGTKRLWKDISSLPSYRIYPHGGIRIYTWETGSEWWVDDVRVQRATYVEPTLSIGAEQSKPAGNTAVAVTTYQYDSLDRLTMATYPGSLPVAYTYDYSGLRTKVTLPDGKAITSTYDGAGRLQSVVDWQSRSATYSYDGNRLAGLTLPNSTSASYAFDRDNRVTAITNTSSVSGTLSNLKYTYDGAGNRTVASEFVSSTRQLTMNLFFDDVEALASAWTATGFWHPVTETAGSCFKSYSASHSWYYGVDASCTYESGTTNSGSLTSASIDIPANVSSASLSFAYWYQTRDSGPSYDQRFVQISTDGGQNWTNLRQLYFDEMQYWYNPALSLTSYKGSRVKLRFQFNSVNGNSGSNKGWFIDDVRVTATYTATSPTLWPADVRVNDDVNYPTQQYAKVAADGRGNVHAIWQDYRNGGPDIYYARLPLTATTWLANVKINDGAGSTDEEFPNIATDRLGNAHAVCVDRRNGNRDIYYAWLSPISTTWSANLKVNDDGGSADQSDPAIAVDSAGNVFAAWGDDRNGPEDWDVYAAMLRVDSSAWSTNLKVTDVPGGHQEWPDISVNADATNNFHVVWQDWRNGNDDIYYSMLSTHLTRTQNIRVNDDNTTQEQGKPSVAADGFGNVYSVWEDYRNGAGDIYFARLKAGESNWSANKRINDDTGQNAQARPQIVADRDGNLQAVWHDNRSGNYDIYRSKLAAGSTTWTPNARVNSDSGTTEQSWADIALDSTGAAVIVWRDYRDGDLNIYSTRDPYVTNAYTYDSLYRLKEAGSPSASTLYEYDATGNRTVYTDTGKVITYTYDANDRMATIGGQSATWDANGNLLSKDGVTYTYDSANRLTTVVSATLVATFEYDADGLRTSATINGQRTDYLWDVVGSLPVVLSDTNSVYVNGLGLIARQTGADVEYYHTDALGSVRSLTNGSGQNVGAYSYKPFGEPAFSSGTSSNRFRYTGQMSDPEAGLYYLRARYYEPGTGRFPTKDLRSGNTYSPQSLNRYVYVGNRPLIAADPTGEFWPFDNWEEWVESLLSATATPAYAPAEEGELSDLDSLVEISEESGTGAALPWIEKAASLHPYYRFYSAASALTGTDPVTGEALSPASRLETIAFCFVGKKGGKKPGVQKKAPEQPSQYAKRRLAKEQGGIPRSAQPTRQGKSSDGTRWWEYYDSEGKVKIVVEHPDKSVHIGTPKPQSNHYQGEPPRYWQVPGSGHVGD